MKRMTSVKFPSAVSVERDAAGFSTSEVIAWGDSYPATVRDTTNRETVAAHQTGYDIDKIFVVRCYGGQNILKDDADECVYDVHRTYAASGTREIILECSRREPGCGYPGR
ncbi:hypothetical protein [Blautia obeum]|uniref:Head-tail adaptor protein n=1 Tax=Blautia obeum TaxID=40520 RepID=A0A3E5A4Z8_9FIRM|nr:hypothetical protein [Blautia obeum]RGN03783.1 hypothetical protein DXB81_11585 [Blautia obeum]